MHTDQSCPRIGSLFSGYGGLDMGVETALGGTVAWHVDNDLAATRVLARHWPDAPNHGDVTTVDWHRVEPVDVLTGGFPCQDLSTAGHRAGLIPETRSGLWTHMTHAIAVLQPDLVVIENVRGILSAPAHRDLEPHETTLGNRRDQPVLRALGAVLGDLASLGYDARWCGLRASDIGAPHARYRVFIVATAHPTGNRRHARWTEPSRQLRGPDATERGAPPTHADDIRQQRDRSARHRWGRPPHHRVATPHTQSTGRCEQWAEYAPAIHRWERILGRPAPEPTTPGRRGNPVLNPVFVEWLMGLRAGHVTDTPGLTRNQQLHLLGNGVLPHQATTALHQLTTTTNTQPTPA